MLSNTLMCYMVGVHLMLAQVVCIMKYAWRDTSAEAIKAKVIVVADAFIAGCNVQYTYIVNPVCVGSKFKM